MEMEFASTREIDSTLKHPTNCSFTCLHSILENKIKKKNRETKPGRADDEGIPNSLCTHRHRLLELNWDLFRSVTCLFPPTFLFFDFYFFIFFLSFFLSFSIRVCVCVWGSRKQTIFSCQPSPHCI